MVKEEKTEKAVVRYDRARLKANAGVGMRGVDPLDIRPPQILLLQGLSDFGQFIDGGGKQAKAGQFFHTGKMEIYDSFECYFLFAAKSKYTDKRKPQEGEKDQYKAIGVLASDFSLFGETFRSSMLFTLGGLFTATKHQERPMYSFLVKMETKELSNKEGTWFIPVCRILKEETDASRLMLLEDQAKALDLRTEEIVDEEIDRSSEEPH